MAAANKSGTDVTAVSVHGTGTPLGDPIEVGALGLGLKFRDAVSSNVLMLSNKACFGHTEGAAGLSGEQHHVAHDLHRFRCALAKYGCGSDIIIEAIN